MARIMVCDDDRELTRKLLNALRAAGHEAETCRHTMDVLREASGGRFDLVAFGLELPGFGRNGAIEAMREVAPHVALIAIHESPAAVLREMARARVAAVLPRPVVVKDFIEAVGHALRQQELPALHA
ncbi:MAG: hypothetical protein ABR577_11340 [Pyrinomonadaceae bacterium]